MSDSAHYIGDSNTSGRTPDLNFTNHPTGQPLSVPDYNFNPFTLFTNNSPVMYNGVGLVQSNDTNVQNLFGAILNSGYNIAQEPALVNAAQGVGGAMTNLFGGLSR